MRERRVTPPSGPRVKVAAPPFAPDVAEMLNRATPAGMEPLTLFRSLARDTRLLTRFMRGTLLDAGHLTVRQREIVIDRTTALCGSEYEWGVHIALFGSAAAFTDTEMRALASESGDALCWSMTERTLIRVCDALHRDADIDDSLWADLTAAFGEEAALEVLMLAGFYHTVSYLTNALRLAPESFAARFPA